MNLIVPGEGGHIIKIAPDGTETNVMDRRISEATYEAHTPAP